MVLPEVQGLCAGQEANEDLPCSKDTGAGVEEVQKKVVLCLEIQHVELDLGRFVNYPLKNFDISKYVISPKLPHQTLQDKDGM